MAADTFLYRHKNLAESGKSEWVKYENYSMLCGKNKGKILCTGVRGIYEKAETLLQLSNQGGCR